MINNKKKPRLFGKLAAYLATCLAAASLLTCTQVPDYCGKGVWYNPDFEFCDGTDNKYNLCGTYKYNPRTEGCIAGATVGTKCADSTVVKLGTPCGGYILSLGVAPAGGGEVAGAPLGKTPFGADDPVTLYAHPTEGYRFIGWAGAENAKSGSIKLTMDGNKSLIAMFSFGSAHNLVASAFPKEGGTVAIVGGDSGGEVTKECVAGDAVSVRAEAAPGFAFAGWSGSLSSAAQEVRVEIGEDGATLVAMFTPVVYSLRVNTIPEAGGTVFVDATALSGETKINAGTTVTLLAVPADGYGFTGWSDAAGTGTAIPHTNPTKISLTRDSLTINARFEKGAGVVVPPPGEDGDGDGDGDDTYNYDPVKIGDLTWTKNINIETADSWCYDNDTANCAKYGRLYTWEAAKGACESMGGGWRLPTHDDWGNLVNYAGGNTIAGKKLKSKSGWISHNGITATDDFGFSALPGGYRNYDGGNFGDVGRYGYWWSAEECGSGAFDWSMQYYGDDAVIGGGDVRSGFSVRCVEDNAVTPPPPATYHLTLTANPQQGGWADTVDTDIHTNPTFGISATASSGYAFVNWTVVSGEANIANANSAATTVTLSGDAVVRANFEQRNSFTDARDGKSYRTVKIGNQTWMAENLNYQMATTSTDSSWCYDNSYSNCTKYGRLYNWYAAMNACPSGWKLPEMDDWRILIEAALVMEVWGLDTNWYFESLGTKFKSTTGWNDYGGNNGNGTDDYGFSALPGGGRYGWNYGGVGDEGSWWTATAGDNVDGLAGFTYTSYDNDDVFVDVYRHPECGLSVRCIVTPPSATYTLTVNRNNSSYGTVTPTSQPGVVAGQEVAITATPASGYTFQYWSTSSGYATIANTNSAATTVTLTWSVAITANFQWVLGGQFNPNITYTSFTDARNSKTYKTVKIGDQTWMAENLNYQTTDSWCSSGNNSNCDRYGRLYTWNAAMSACPDGWKLPTNEEWSILVTYAGGSSVAGKKLKSTTGWNDYRGNSGNGTDEFGFSALPGGLPTFDGDDYAGSYGGWWSATEYVESYYAYRWIMHHSNDNASGEKGQYDNKINGYSVRCLQD